MPSSRRVVVNGRLVDRSPWSVGGSGISWWRALLLAIVVAILLATNPVHEANVARYASQWKVDDILHKWTGARFSTSNSYYWKRRTTNYFVAALKERSNGLEIGALQRSFHVCKFDDADWGSVCRSLRGWFSHPGVEWWRLPMDQPPVVVHRLLTGWLLLVSGMVACHVFVPLQYQQDPLLSMFLPPAHASLPGWLFQTLVDTNILLYPVWERLYQLTILQATTSPCRIAGTDDALNFYAAIFVLLVVAAGVRILTGHAHSPNANAWLVWVLVAVGYWRGTFARQEERISYWTLKMNDVDSDQETNNLVMLFLMRMGWLVLTHGIGYVFDQILTWALALLVGAALGDYHYSQQIWEVWYQSWSKFVDDTWAQLFGRPRYYGRGYDY